ncbi:MAG: hypothetical protein GY819_07175, partial [Planctomycetaceae bacterium]|nr:hypothetical protein [Planctomycetaceae bacterium]MCP4462563.1 hypothetical protein [Planctomycetaceae bacterium]
MSQAELPSTEPNASPVTENRNLATLLVVFGGVGTLTLGLVFALGNTEMLIAAGLSFAFCALGAIIAHFFSIYPRGDAFLVSRLYLSMAARVGLPLALLVVCKTNFEALLVQGMVYFVILFYLVGLLTELKTRMRTLGIGQGAKSTSTVSPTAKMDV